MLEALVHPSSHNRHIWSQGHESCGVWAPPLEDRVLTFGPDQNALLVLHIWFLNEWSITEFLQNLTGRRGIWERSFSATSPLSWIKRVRFIFCMHFFIQVLEIRRVSTKTQWEEGRRCRSRQAAERDERGVTRKLHLCNHESLQTSL